MQDYILIIDNQSVYVYMYSYGLFKSSMSLTSMESIRYFHLNNYTISVTQNLNWVKKVYYNILKRSGSPEKKSTFKW